MDRRGGTPREKSVSVNVTLLTANATNYVGIMCVRKKIRVLRMDVGFQDAPASTLGTVLLNIYNYDVSGTVERRLNETADYDCEGLTDKTPAEVAEQTSNPEYLACDPGDMLYATIISNNGDMTDGEGGVITLTYEEI